ncbi:myb/SANT-like DNA-binding domain-containing protein 3 [Ischnura elegans]|uniref:myb/SANT-like DNA-binding domain-containing protein 3 n=1 Tax=Ischnura elegans TaxID=197161 RepID=UPI001ED8910A|nr:myb/SANT-like DNA-binding domain-containing protein 3 [Ischnura elegans]
METGEGSRITTEEKNLIVDLVIARKAVLESKKTDAVSLTSKSKAWKEVEEEFNRHDGVTKRSWKQIKRSWENMKAKRKRDLAAANRQRMGAGGGPYIPPTVDTSPELELAIPAIQHTLPNTGDSDRMPEVEVPYVAEVRDAVETPSTSGTRRQSSRSVADRELEARLEMVSRATEDEAYICQMRRELAMMDMKVKENEIAASAAKRVAAEEEAATWSIRRAAAEADREAARQRLAASALELENAQAARGHQQELFKLQKEKMMREMEPPHQC